LGGKRPVQNWVDSTRQILKILPKEICGARNKSYWYVSGEDGGRQKPPNRGDWRSKGRRYELPFKSIVTRDNN